MLTIAHNRTRRDVEHRSCLARNIDHDFGEGVVRLGLLNPEPAHLQSRIKNHQVLDAQAAQLDRPHLMIPSHKAMSVARIMLSLPEEISRDLVDGLIIHHGTSRAIKTCDGIAVSNILISINRPDSSTSAIFHHGKQSASLSRLQVSRLEARQGEGEAKVLGGKT